MCELKKDCHWYLLKRPSHHTGCALLSELRCAKCNCTFYETDSAFIERQNKHQERINRVPQYKTLEWEEKGYKAFKSFGNEKSRGAR